MPPVMGSVDDPDVADRNRVADWSWIGSSANMSAISGFRHRSARGVLHRLGRFKLRLTTEVTSRVSAFRNVGG